jgi:sec-independent protein translocase protein TatB
MFNLGPFELVAIFVVALLVFGPEKLPEMGKQVGKAVREFRKFQESMQSNVRDVIDPITGPITSNGPVGPAPTNIRGGNIPRSATIQGPEIPEGEAAEPPGTYGHYTPVDPPASTDTAAPAGESAAPAADAPSPGTTAPAGDQAPPPASRPTDPDAG